MILVTGKNTSSRNSQATLAFMRSGQAASQNNDDADSRAIALRIAVEQVDGKFRASLHIQVASSFSVIGPSRTSRPEAINDGVELGNVYVAEGPAGARRVAVSLANRKWSLKEIEEADESALEGFAVSTGLTPDVIKKLLPRGEGWVRHDDATLVNPQSQIFFVKTGQNAGSYMKQDPVSKNLVNAGEPHVPTEFKTTIRGASASWLRKGAKLDRAVLLNDITKIARLALKFPLSFVDQPACAYALFQGLRSAESAQWCAENFHKKLLPLLAEKIHSYEVSELEKLLEKTLEALDAELLKSAHAFSGCSAILALVLGEWIVLAGVGHVRAVLLPEKGKLTEVAACAGSLQDAAEVERVQEASGIIRSGMLFGIAEDLDEASRILAAHSAFEVLQIEPGGPTDEKQIRSAYRKLALRVHPDKQADSARDAFRFAFARLDSAKDALEAMLAEDAESCREIHKVLRADVHTRTGAAALLGVDAAAGLDTNVLAAEAEKFSKRLVKRFEKMAKVCPEFDSAVAACEEAVATLRRTCAEEALPRYEALLKEGLSSSRAMGARDLRSPRQMVLMKPQSANLKMPKCRGRLALLCGPTASLSNEKLLQCTAKLQIRPKACALRWCMEADAECTSSAVCISLEPAGSLEPPSKKLKTSAGGPEGIVRVRHILFRWPQLRQDAMARREGSAKNVLDAESAALAALEKILQEPTQFLKLCRELSDCQSAEQPGQLTGDLGWIGRGQLEQSLEEVAFGLSTNGIGDIVTTSRGVHIIQRLG